MSARGNTFGDFVIMNKRKNKIPDSTSKTALLVGTGQTNSQIPSAAAATGQSDPINDLLKEKNAASDPNKMDANSTRDKYSRRADDLENEKNKVPKSDKSLWNDPKEASEYHEKRAVLLRKKADELKKKLVHHSVLSRVKPSIFNELEKSINAMDSDDNRKRKIGQILATDAQKSRNTKITERLEVLDREIEVGEKELSGLEEKIKNLKNGLDTLKTEKDNLQSESKTINETISSRTSEAETEANSLISDIRKNESELSDDDQKKLFAEYVINSQIAEGYDHVSKKAKLIHDAYADGKSVSDIENYQAISDEAQKVSDQIIKYHSIFSQPDYPSSSAAAASSSSSHLDFVETNIDLALRSLNV